MLLELPKKDILHALDLRWRMITRTDRWQSLGYEGRARLRVEHGEVLSAALAQIDRRGGREGVYDIDIDLVSFARKLITSQVLSSYLICLLPAGTLFGALGVALVGVIAELFTSSSAAPVVNPLYAMIVCTIVLNIVPTAILAWLRGSWRSHRLIRHYRQARRDPTYRLPKPHTF